MAKETKNEPGDAGGAGHMPEFSVMVDMRNLGDAPTYLAANKAQCAALATRFGIEEMSALTATIAYQQEDGGVMAEGHIAADIVQQCVVSLEPFASHVTQDFAIRFQPGADDAPPAPDAAPEGEDSFEIGEDDCDVMQLVDGRFDIGEAAAQTLALALNPFPRGPDAEKVAEAHGLVTEVPKDNPFAVLEQLKKKG